MAIFLKLLLAFLFGGALCVIAQLLIDKTKLTPARILVGYVVAGVLLGVQHLTGIVALDPEAYLLSAVPVAFGWGWWLAVDVLLPLILLALLMIPVAITSRVRPDQTLKYQ